MNLFNQIKNSEIEKKDNNELAIVGIAFKLPEAENITDLFLNLLNEKNSVRNVPTERRTDIEQYGKALNLQYTKYLKKGYLERIDTFDNEFFNISPNEAKMMDPNQRIFLEKAYEAIENAGFRKKDIDGKKVGVFLGYRGDDIYTYKNLIAKYGKNIESAMTGNINSIIASRLSYLLNLKGPSLCIDTACSSGLAALHYACSSLRNRECDAAIVGSIKLNLYPAKDEQEIGIESELEEIRSFDDFADGTVSGEGCIVFVVKRKDDAIKEKNNIYAVIKGSAINQDGHSIGLTAPSALAQKELLINAWKDAQINPESISYIETHGTGTKLGDPIEVNAINMAFEEYTNRKQFCGIGSIKSNIGHLDCASGLAGVLKMIVCFMYKKLFATINFVKPNKEIDFLKSAVYVNTNVIEWKDKTMRCGVNSFGLSGTNVHVVLENYPFYEYTTESENSSEKNIFLLSAKNPESLKVYLNKYSLFLEHNQVNIKNLMHTLINHRNVYQYKCCIVFSNINDLKNKLQIILNNYNCLHERKDIYLFDDSYEVYKFENNLEEHLYIALCKWLKQEQYKIEGGTIISLPTYPFVHKRFWIENVENDVKIKLCGKKDNKYSEMEYILASVWKETLGVSEINVYDKWQNLGGDSILAIKAYNLLKEKGYIGISVIDILNNSLVENSLIVKKNKFKKKIESEVNFCELIEQQRPIYYSYLIDKSSLQYNLPMLFEITDKNNIEMIKKTLQEVVKNNRCLNSCLVYKEKILQKKLELKDWKVEEIWDDCDQNELFARYTIPFDIFNEPLFKAKILHCKNKAYLFLDVHHIIVDGHSLQILLDDFASLYEGRKLENKDYDFYNYIEEHKEYYKTSDFEKANLYWETYLKNFPDTKRLMNSCPMEYNSEIVYFDIQDKILKKMNTFLKKYEVSFYSLNLSIYLLSLHKITKKDELIIGVPVDGRNTNSVQNQIGMFVKNLPLISKINDENFIDYLKKIDKEIKNMLLFFDGFQYELLEKTGKHLYFDTLYSHQNFHNKIISSNCLKQIFPERRKTAFDIILQTTINENQISGFFEYRKDIYSKSEINKIIQYMNDFVENIEDNCTVQLKNLVEIKAQNTFFDKEFNF